MTPAILLLLCFFFGVFSMAVNWYLQLVHYPMLDQVGKNEFQDYNRIVGPWRRLIVYFPGTTTFLLLLYVIYSPPWEAQMTGLYISVLLVACMLALSLFVYRPMHYVLATHGYSNKTIKRLIRVQWLRTLGWSVNAGVLAWVVLEQMKI